MCKNTRIDKDFFERGNAKVCIPLMGKSKSDIFENLTEVLKYRPDVIEWRADFFEDVLNVDENIEVICNIKKSAGTIPVLFTIRTLAEGGELAITKKDYKGILLEIVKRSDIDLIDVEYMMGPAVTTDIIRIAHEKAVLVIGSNHDFDKTPDSETIYDRLIGMKLEGMDVSKIAVMPKSYSDVVRLLEITCRINEEYEDIKTITMSMGDIGAISRIVGNYFGSVMTFGAANMTSAPGQIRADNLKNIINSIKDNIQNTKG